MPELPPGASAFTWRRADPSFGHSFYAGPITLATSAGPCRFTYDEAARRATIECLAPDGKRRWGHDEGRAFVEDAALLADAQQLYVARFSDIATGCTLRAFDLRTGEEHWLRHLDGMGSVAHSEYLNEVELDRLAAGVLRVLGWESAGRYVELVEPTLGHPLGLFRFEGAVPRRLPPTDVPDAVPPQPGAAASIPWRWSGPEPSRKTSASAELVVPGGPTCRFSLDDAAHAAHLACVDGAGKRLHGMDWADPVHSSVALASGGPILYAAFYSPIASGAEVAAYDLDSGAPRWRRRLHGLGPIGHSKYRNEVELSASDGRVTAFGWESSGKYVEVLDASSGRPLGNRPEP